MLNDLKDWSGDTDNKLVAGQDALALRPTVLLALALKDTNDEQKTELKQLLSETPGRSSNHQRIDRLRRSSDPATCSKRQKCWLNGRVKRQSR